MNVRASFDRSALCCALSRICNATVVSKPSVKDTSALLCRSADRSRLLSICANLATPPPSYFRGHYVFRIDTRQMGVHRVQREGNCRRGSETHAVRSVQPARFHALCAPLVYSLQSSSCVSACRTRSLQRAHNSFRVRRRCLPLIKWSVPGGGPSCAAPLASQRQPGCVVRR